MIETFLFCLPATFLIWVLMWRWVKRCGQRTKFVPFLFASIGSVLPAVNVVMVVFWIVWVLTDLAEDDFDMKDAADCLRKIFKRK